ncbi:MAG TPA: sigma-54 dependent transcriptional regulator [Bdellovibrionota bacterium]|nr:sigma-54 dependent transcriptional regulator [Bdellovibrionota bacterium]
MPRILLVDDDPQALESTRKILELSGYEVVTAVDGQAALEQIRPSASGRLQKFDLVVTDVRMPRLGGLEFLRALSLCGETTPVILMTAFGRVEDAVWAMKLGAVDFLTKPFKRQALLSSVEAVLKRAKAAGAADGELRVKAETGIETTSSPDAKLIGHSAAMRALKDTIRQVAPTAATILLTGESGTGKELVAHCIHQMSPRAGARFIALNCGAVPEQLIESELFGFEKGAFTGATGSKEGLFEAAHGGTLLLDEIGDMPFPLQSKLLRTLQEGEVRRLGATVSRKVDVRVIAATHRNLKESVRAGTFRQDLLYRLEVIGIEVPELRARIEDVPELARHFLNVASARHGKPTTSISKEALKVLLSHQWPGNVRELSNVVERAVVFAKGSEITVDELPAHLLALAGAAAGARLNAEGESRAEAGAKPGAGSPAGAGGGTIEVPLGASLKEIEELLIRKTLEATSGDKNMTAKLLGINSRTIYRKLDKR